jgi:ABC-type branched-subunit amino acid transport system ATPase component
LRCKKGSLVAVVGGVASGKSSLLAACFGDMDKISGKVHTKVTNLLSLFHIQAMGMITITYK